MILVTGGCGYIGSHVALTLARLGKTVVIIDDGSNSDVVASCAAFQQAGFETTLHESFGEFSTIENAQIMIFETYTGFTGNMRRIFRTFQFEAVIHCAGLKSVPDSFEDHERYYEVNVTDTVALMNLAREFKVPKFVFSSSASVYQPSDYEGVTEKSPLGPQSPYAMTKMLAEYALRLLVSERTKLACLRYFNPLGADATGLFGDNPPGDRSTNIMPVLTRCWQQGKPFNINGNTYYTQDGTPVRDYIHISDLAHAHVRALEILDDTKDVFTVNIGTGEPTTVRWLVSTFNSQLSESDCVRVTLGPRRTGDAPYLVADTTYAQSLGFPKYTRTVVEMCESHIAFITRQQKQS